MTSVNFSSIKQMLASHSCRRLSSLLKRTIRTGVKIAGDPCNEKCFKDHDRHSGKAIHMLCKY